MSNYKKLPTEAEARKEIAAMTANFCKQMGYDLSVVEEPYYKGMWDIRLNGQSIIPMYNTRTIPSILSAACFLLQLYDKQRKEGAL